MSSAPLRLGGFFTWNGGRDDPHVYIRPARTGADGHPRRLAGGDTRSHRLASYDPIKGGLVVDAAVFEREGARMLSDIADTDLIIMDELGFLESEAPLFRQAALDALDAGVPALGVLRLGNVPWHDDIKRKTGVSLYDVSIENRDNLPREIAGAISDILARLNNLNSLLTE